MFNVFIIVNVGHKCIAYDKITCLGGLYLHVSNLNTSKETRISWVFARTPTTLLESVMCSDICQKSILVD